MNELGERAIECCIEYDQAKRKIDRLTSQIHDCFSSCEQRQREKLREEWDGNSPEWKFNRDVLSEVEPCIQMGYAGWDANCKDCEQAYKLIQERKEARQEFGVAKRRVRAVARSKYNQDD